MTVLHCQGGDLNMAGQRFMETKCPLDVSIKVQCSQSCFECLLPPLRLLLEANSVQLHYDAGSADWQPQQIRRPCVAVELDGVVSKRTCLSKGTGSAFKGGNI